MSDKPELTLYHRMIVFYAKLMKDTDRFPPAEKEIVEFIANQLKHELKACVRQPSCERETSQFVDAIAHVMSTHGRAVKSSEPQTSVDVKQLGIVLDHLKKYWPENIAKLCREKCDRLT